MKQILRISPGLRRLAASLLVTSLVARALIPLGYMPGNLLAGEIMAMCPAASAATLALLAQREPHHVHPGDPADDARSADETCPIGSALSYDAMSADRAPDSLPPQIDRVPLPATVDHYIAAVNRAYPARGPPAP